MHAPKQKGNVKKQLGYIGRYIKRPAIVIKRIQSYDGMFVEFSYQDKTSSEEKMEKVTLEEFIARVIRHIPDENFKTIRYYGVYSRKLKKLSKILVADWRKEARKWIVRAQRQLKRRNWRERIERCEKTRGCLERMIRDLTGKQENQKQKEETAVVHKQLPTVKAGSKVYMFDLFGSGKHPA